jgi:hypothetical protein
VQTETLPKKRTMLQEGGQRKNMKAHKDVPEFTITEDDAEMVEEKVQDHVAESWDDAEKQREEIIKKLSEVKETLVQLQLSTVQQKEKAQPQQTVQEQQSQQETIQIIASGSENFLSLGICCSWMRKQHRKNEGYFSLGLGIGQDPHESIVQTAS